MWILNEQQCQQSKAKAKTLKSRKHGCWLLLGWSKFITNRHNTEQSRETTETNCHFIVGPHWKAVNWFEFVVLHCLCFAMHIVTASQCNCVLASHFAFCTIVTLDFCLLFFPHAKYIYRAWPFFFFVHRNLHCKSKKDYGKGGRQNQENKLRGGEGK